MQIDGWRYYSRAAIPTTPPHEPANINPIADGSIWKLTDSAGNTPMLVRWIEDFDCGYETNWWYVIKDTPFEISTLKSNYRYKINKGLKMFDVRVIDPLDYTEELYETQAAAYSAYPKKYRPTANKDSFMQSISQWNQHAVFGAFFRETNELVGYSILIKTGQHIDLAVLKSRPDYERFQINAALVAGILNHFCTFLQDGGYICDGSRSINHETAFQDYLEKYFGFRKAYCKLHIRYKWWLAFAIKCLYPFRKLLVKLDRISPIHLVNSLLKMEEYSAKRDKCI